jgi:Bacterial Ig-like domain (group 2)
MGKVIVNVCGHCRPRKVKARRRFVFRWATGTQTYVEGLMARITNEQQVSVTVVPKTAAGRPAAIDGDVTFTSSDDTVATVESTGPTTGLVKAVAPGVAQIVAKFDADLDEGEVRELEFTGAIEVVAAEAETAEIVFGEPELTPLP